ncbi:MAG: N-6 DNA Methylase family [Microgenomates group bacterium GW2011_GWC1_39_7]|nr:MAG: N-6 DNA Methylase family [Microgenomates group bacterium GW2011_GWC1_39_7]
MTNERKTESIVRSHFEQFKDLVELEEQASDIPKIDKLLKTASKKGGGKGKPEFLITFKSNSDLLIVIECKADVSKHESKSKDKFSDYAVDGTLLYSSYLSKEFDILAIAVSGEDARHLKISHFLQLKNEKKATSIFGEKLLSAQNYLDGYLKSPEKFRQDYNTLLDFAKHLNEELHSNKDELESANIIGKKLENLDIQFSFIKTDTSLSTKNNVLKDLIDEIDENINSFIKTHEYFDVLGQLYIEFLRYANSDKGLGIVLTPPHITELFSELAQVNKKTIVYDNCTGTGGFLISAMQKMIQDAKDDQETIKNIKANQLIGVEYQSHIFALAISNMYIHQDGKTNIMRGSCFDKDIIDAIKKKMPTVGLLNPPYKGDKKTDTEELEFILNNLECLVDGGTCIAIVPMERALAQNGKVYELKKQLLQKHTLEAVLSMPNELFANSKVAVVSCAMIFTAHKPHPKNKETYFGYYKDDGFVKRKIKGRIDAFGKWDSIKEKWISYFINRKSEAGFSINKAVSAEEEWVAEAYMETDYSSLSKEDFINEVKKYVAFNVLNK